MKVQAKAKGIKITPRKLGLVAGLIRLRKVEDALTILEHTPKKGARMLHEIVQSALANAENNHKLAADNLVVESVLVGPGPILKRILPAAHGRANRINYRSSNVTVVLDELVSKSSKVKAGAK